MANEYDKLYFRIWMGLSAILTLAFGSTFFTKIEHIMTWRILLGIGVVISHIMLKIYMTICSQNSSSGKVEK